MSLLAPKANVNQEALFELVDYKPHHRQKLYHESRARFTVPTCGRRFGKSVMAGRKILAGLFIPDTRYWIVGPTYALGEKEFRVVYDDLFRRLGFGNQKGIKKSYNVDQGNMRIEMPWNSILEVKSAEKQDSLVGESLDGVCLSEAALHRKDTWDMYLRPALTDKRGWATFPSTPRGHNWYEAIWRIGQDPSFPEWESWRFPSWDNPYVYPLGRQDPEILEIEKLVSEYHFQQEYAAEFTAFEGKIYSEFDPTFHVIDYEYQPMWRNYQVWDFGYTDPTVVLDIQVDPSDRAYVWREYHVTDKTAFEHATIIKNRDNPPNYRIDGIFGDPRGADEIATVQMILGRQIVANPVPWIQGIEAVKRAFKKRADGTSGLYFDRRCTNTIRSVGNLRAVTPTTDKNARSKTGAESQHGYDDHEADALRYFFNERFVLNYGGNLSGIYSGGQKASEADTYFQHLHSFINDGTFAKI